MKREISVVSHFIKCLFERCPKDKTTDILSQVTLITKATLSISDRVDRASATETVDWGSIPSRVKPKTIKTGIYSFPA